MQYEEFVLRQLKRNEKIYSVCMKVFLVFMIVFVLALIGILIGGLGIEMTIFDVILMLIIAVEYPTFKKLKDQANFASAEIEAALVTTGFPDPGRLYGQDEEDPKQDRTGTEETDDIGCFDRYSGFDLLWRNGDDFMGLFIFRI